MALVLCLVQDETPKDSPEDEKARPVVERAMALIKEAKGAEKKEERDAKYTEAIESFRDVVKNHKKSRYYGTSYFNVGVILCDFLDRPEDAIKHFRELVASEVDDRDDSGQLMSPYRNYRYHAWRLTAACESKLKRPARAITAVFAMRDAYVSHCGT
jgi:tetratricopeptide (TPR) repeat protein